MVSILRNITILLFVNLVIGNTTGFAQNFNQEFRVNIYQTRVIDGPSDGVFNTTSLGFEYQHAIGKNINGVIKTRFLQTINTKGDESNSGNIKLNQGSVSALTFDWGLSLTTSWKFASHQGFLCAIETPSRP